MIEETAYVMETQGEHAWVETQRRSSCGSCAAKGCGTGALSKILGGRRQRLKVLNPVDAKAGEEVILGVREQDLLKGSLAVYIVPLLLMLAGALFGEFLAPQWEIEAEPLSLFFGLLGLIGGFFWLHRYNRALSRDGRLMAVILRKSTPASAVHNISINL
ncbi:MAG: SoxR reducing system RseC family protein [Gammaproteobacteria bacterium]|nr:SoxR reducing system RseC family protein [Gammaproteobacteria bacterium]